MYVDPVPRFKLLTEMLRSDTYSSAEFPVYLSISQGRQKYLLVVFPSGLELSVFAFRVWDEVFQLQLIKQVEIRGNPIYTDTRYNGRVRHNDY